MDLFTYVWSMEIGGLDVDVELNDTLVRHALDSARILSQGAITRVEQTVILDFERNSHHLTVEVTMEVSR